MATLVLVHGAWGGSWVWKKMIPLLRAAGHDVHASTATGLGDRVHLAGPAVDLDTHITDVVNLLEFEDLTGVTLVGWNYGGMIITGVAERVPDRLAGLVYLDALVPADGENSYDAERSSEDVRAVDRAAAEAAGMPGFLMVEPYADWLGSLTLDPADREWLLTRLVPQPLATYPAHPAREPNGRGDPPSLCLLHRSQGGGGRLREHGDPTPDGSRLALPRTDGQPPGADQRAAGYGRGTPVADLGCAGRSIKARGVSSAER